MIVKDTYIIGDKTYSKEQLIAFGKEHYPKFYWITRGIGIFLLFLAFLVCSIIGIVMLILNATGVFTEDFPIWAFYIPLGVFGFIGVSGIICIIVSCFGRNHEKYLNHALAYLTKANLKQEHNKQKVDPLLSKRDIETLNRYERLYKGGVISKEEYEEKRKEILG